MSEVNYTGLTAPYLDKHHFYENREDWLCALTKFNLRPGSGIECDQVNETNFESVAVEVNAGSCILAALAVLPESLRRNATLVTGVAVDQEGNTHPDSKLFLEFVNSLGITTTNIKVKGVNPTIHVLVDPESGERSFVKETGISKDIAYARDHVPKGNVVIMDTRELVSGSSSDSLWNLLSQQDETSIIMTLGSDENLKSIRDRLSALLKKGSVKSVFCNIGEFSELMGEKFDFKDSDKIRNAINSVGLRRVDFYITAGSEGIIAVLEEGSVYSHSRTINPSEIVSTSGAGDAAMGIILGSMALGEPIKTGLLRANYHCANIIKSHKDIIPYPW